MRKGVVWFGEDWPESDWSSQDGRGWTGHGSGLERVRLGMVWRGRLVLDLAKFGAGRVWLVEAWNGRLRIGKVRVAKSDRHGMARP